MKLLNYVYLIMKRVKQCYHDYLTEDHFKGNVSKGDWIKYGKKSITNKFSDLPHSHINVRQGRSLNRLGTDSR